jgi:Domain of unknown function DUF29
VDVVELDWPNIAAEIESMGRERLHAVQSLLRRAIVRILKAEAWPLSRDAPAWRADAIPFRTDMASRMVPSMPHSIDLDRIYRQAPRALPETADSVSPLPVSEVCPFGLDELLSEVTESGCRACEGFELLKWRPECFSVGI